MRNCLLLPTKSFKHGPLDMEITVTNLKTNFMKKYHVMRTVTCAAFMLVAMVYSTCVFAQAKVDDKEIIGTWIMTSMKFEGENRELIGENYNQVKVYRANGEYACAEIIKCDGGYQVRPHEYGTYSLKNGQYSEMGRKPITYGWIDKTTTQGRWFNRLDRWKKVEMPEKLVQHIVDKCKANQSSPKDLQNMMAKYIFGK